MAPVLTMPNPDFRKPSLLRSFKCAVRGLLFLLRSQRNVRIHAAAAAAALALAHWLQLGVFDHILVVIAIVTVFSAEALNSSIEVLTDMVSREHTEKAGRVKDMAAAACLIASLGAGFIGVCVLGPPLFARFFM